MCRNEAFIAKELPALRGASGAEIISMLDADNDGSVSKAEFQEALLKLFSSMVADRIVDHIFGLFDKDKSGSLEANELWALCKDQERLKKTIPVLVGMKSADVAKFLDRDEGNDGVITRQEFHKALQSWKRAKVKEARKAIAPAKKELNPKSLPQDVPITDLVTLATLMASHVFACFDSDKSGNLSNKEVAAMCRNEEWIAKELPALQGAAAGEIINMLDADHDGSVSKAEFQEALLKLFSSQLADRLVDHIFGLFDKDKSGSLEASELWALCRDQERQENYSSASGYEIC